MLLSSCHIIRQLCQYICLIWTKCNIQCDHGHRCKYFLHYWLAPDKYVCHIPHTCPTALLLWSTYKSHITIYTSPENSLQQEIHKLWPNMCQKQVGPSNAIYANYFMSTYQTTISVYISYDPRNSATRSITIHSTYWHMSLNKFSCHITCLSIQLHKYCSLHVDPIVLHT